MPKKIRKVKVNIQSFYSISSWKKYWKRAKLLKHLSSSPPESVFRYDAFGSLRDAYREFATEVKGYTQWYMFVHTEWPHLPRIRRFPFTESGGLRHARMPIVGRSGFQPDGGWTETWQDPNSAGLLRVHHCSRFRLTATNVGQKQKWR